LLRLKKKVYFTPLPLRIQRQPKHPLNPSHLAQYLELSHMLYMYTTAHITARTGYGTTKTQIIETEPLQRPTLYSLPTHFMQGRCLKTAPKSRLRRASPAIISGEDQIRPNLDDIINIHAINFA
jgi:hypothetical protein